MEKLLFPLILLSALSGCSSEDNAKVGHPGKSEVNVEVGRPSKPATSPQTIDKPSPQDEQVVAELRKQTELLERRESRQKAEEATKAKLTERESQIKDIARSVAKAVDDHGKGVAQAVNRAGGNASEESRLDTLYDELRNILIAETKGIENDDTFHETLKKTANDWAIRKARNR